MLPSSPAGWGSAPSSSPWHFPICVVHQVLFQKYHPVCENKWFRVLSMLPQRRYRFIALLRVPVISLCLIHVQTRIKKFNCGTLPLPGPCLEWLTTRANVPGSTAIHMGTCQRVRWVSPRAGPGIQGCMNSLSARLWLGRSYSNPEDLRQNVEDKSTTVPIDRLCVWVQSPLAFKSPVLSKPILIPTATKGVPRVTI